MRPGAWRIWIAQVPRHIKFTINKGTDYGGRISTHIGAKNNRHRSRLNKEATLEECLFSSGRDQNSRKIFLQYRQDINIRV